MQELSWEAIALRLVCAMVIGLVIGTEREYTHRPAGMRTHILVALGSCTVMITGQMLFIQYSAVGATPDPARLGAQVITGVGFLGAGTILREGANVKGLTTAASLWAVACLGLAAGAGYYALSLMGMVCILVTLTIFEVIQNKLMGTQSAEKEYSITVRDVSTGLKHINQCAESCRTTLRSVTAEPAEDNLMQLRFRAEFSGVKGKKRQQKFFTKLADHPEIIRVSLADEPVGTK